VGTLVVGSIAESLVSPIGRVSDMPIDPENVRYSSPRVIDNVERVLTDIDANNGNPGFELLRHNALLVFGAPCQLQSLAGQEHSRTIPLADVPWRATITWCRLRPLATQQHRYPCAQQCPHELAGMCSVAGHGVGKLYGLRSITRHDAHFNWWRVARKAPAIHREPVPFRELEQHRGIAAGCHHASCWRVWFKPEFLQVLAAFHTDDTISSV